MNTLDHLDLMLLTSYIWSKCTTRESDDRTMGVRQLEPATAFQKQTVGGYLVCGLSPLMSSSTTQAFMRRCARHCGLEEVEPRHESSIALHSQQRGRHQGSSRTKAAKDHTQIRQIDSCTAFPRRHYSQFVRHKTRNGRGSSGWMWLSNVEASPTIQTGVNASPSMLVRRQAQPNALLCANGKAGRLGKQNTRLQVR